MKNRRVRAIAIGIASLTLFVASTFAAPDLREVRATIEGARASALRQRVEENHWDFPAYLGTHFLSQYVWSLAWLGRQNTQLDTHILVDILTRTQLPDGSWAQAPDAAETKGDLNATVLDYGALKSLGFETTDPRLTRARDFILARGGIEATSLFTKIFLALFGDYPWERTASIPLLVASDYSPVRLESLAQWIGPHILPMAYLRHMQLAKDLGPRFRLDELWAPGTGMPVAAKPNRNSLVRRQLVRHLILRLLKEQQPAGSWGAYTPSTLFSLMALQDYAGYYPRYAERVSAAMEKALAFVERRYLQSGDSAYLGVLDDGRYWDTALIANALLDSGMESQSLQATGRFLAGVQTESGGFPFGEDFGYAPDVDDTAEIILALNRLGESPAAVRAARWIGKMQSEDGGWPAFWKTGFRFSIFESWLRPFDTSASLYDPPCADIAGHVLEALASFGLDRASSGSVSRGVDYLERTQDEELGAWSGRWGVNYLYGTSAALVGLRKAGLSTEDPVIARAAQWLRSKQNADGGFGESTESYHNRELAGVGPSTPTQTAWALLALLEVDGPTSPAVEQAVGFLVDTYRRDGQWRDRSAVGTGHPGILYMVYPSYPHAFPLQALSRYRQRRSSAVAGP